LWRKASDRRLRRDRPVDRGLGGFVREVRRHVARVLKHRVLESDDLARRDRGDEQVASSRARRMTSRQRQTQAREKRVEIRRLG
jgi:hypothetical protein